MDGGENGNVEMRWTSCVGVCFGVGVGVERCSGVGNLGKVAALSFGVELVSQ
jgi:hypothetical protein